MLNSGATIPNVLRGELMLSTGQVLKRLGVTRMTLYKWILLKKIKARRHEIGGRVFLEFDPTEVDRVAAKMKEKRKPGKSWFDD